MFPVIKSSIFTTAALNALALWPRVRSIRTIWYNGKKHGYRSPGARSQLGHLPAGEPQPSCLSSLGLGFQNSNVASSVQIRKMKGACKCSWLRIEFGV